MITTRGIGAKTAIRSSTPQRKRISIISTTNSATACTMRIRWMLYRCGSRKCRLMTKSALPKRSIKPKMVKTTIIVINTIDS